MKHTSHLFAAVLMLHTILAAEPLEQTDLFIGRDYGYHTYRIPAMIVTKNGAVLAFCEGRKGGGSDAGDIDILFKRSADGGKTWSPQRVIWDDKANTCGNPCPVLDEETGVIWLLLTHNLGEDKEREIQLKSSQGTRTVWICQSTDDGMTWSTPIEITRDVKMPAWGWYATGPGVGIQIKHGPHKGRLVIPCDHTYDEPKGGSQRMPWEFGAHSIQSDDHGKTWKTGGTIRPRVNECQVVELADGKGTLLMNMRSYFGRARRTHSISDDGGMTWSDPEDHADLMEPVCQASILRYTWPIKGEKSRILFSNPANKEQRRNMTVRLSFDEGASWPIQKSIHPGPSAYSCLTTLPDQTIGCLYERGRTNANEKITFARFSLSWLVEPDP